tara:strand:+ start:677 stop:994 length:318 start_codon:yes stop_codon:yes gene_type:complete
MLNTKKIYNWLLYQAVKKKYITGPSIDENYQISNNSLANDKLWFTREYTSLRKVENFLSVLFYIATLPFRAIFWIVYGYLYVAIAILGFLLFISYLFGHSGFFWE